jgi:hypothetical protein
MKLLEYLSMHPWQRTGIFLVSFEFSFHVEVEDEELVELGGEMLTAAIVLIIQGVCLSKNCSVICHGIYDTAICSIHCQTPSSVRSALVSVVRNSAASTILCLF